MSCDLCVQTFGTDHIIVLLFIRQVCGMLIIINNAKFIVFQCYEFSRKICTEVWMTILESGWNLWVWLVGVVSRRWVWLVGGIYGDGYNV